MATLHKGDNDIIITIIIIVSLLRIQYRIEKGINGQLPTASSEQHALIFSSQEQKRTRASDHFMVVTDKFFIKTPKHVAIKILSACTVVIDISSDYSLF